MSIEIPVFEDSKDATATVETGQVIVSHVDDNVIRRVDCISSTGRTFTMESIDNGEWKEIHETIAAPEKAAAEA